MPYMTDDEIIMLYKRGGCTYKQIRVIAQLNACDIERIVGILTKHGYKIPKRFKAVVPDERKQMVEDDTLERVTIQGVKYKKPFNMSDDVWSEYLENIRNLQKKMMGHKRNASRARKMIKEYERDASRARKMIKKYEEAIPELRIDAEWHDVKADGIQKDIDSFCKYLLEMEVLEKIQSY